MGTEFVPNYVVSVGMVLADDLHALKMTQKELSEAINEPRSVINEIIKGKRKMTRDMAISLEPIFGMPAKYWLDIQSDYELAKRKSEMFLINDSKAIQTSKYTAMEIAYWLINRAKEDAMTFGDYITNLKLQKLLYLAQEHSLQKYNTAIFNEPIKHWKYGPVVESVYHKYNEYGGNPITEAPLPELDEQTTRMLENVYKYFSQYSTSGLVTITHKKAAWKNTSDGEEMTLEQIRGEQQ